MDPTCVDLSVRTGEFISGTSEIPPDITFKFNKSEDDKVSAHKMYLAMVSRVFRDMFYVHNTEDKFADVILMEDTTKPPFQAMIHAIYHFKSMKESLKEMTIDEIFAVLYLVTKYEIPELVLAVEERLSTFPISEENVLEVANNAMEYTSTFGEHAEKLLLYCAEFLKSKLMNAMSPFQALTGFVAENGSHMATVHKLVVVMNDLPPLTCSGCLRMVGGACKDVKQEFYEVSKYEKREKLEEILQSCNPKDKTLVFVKTKKTADFIATHLSGAGFPTTSIHGDCLQREREEALYDFRTGKRAILVATAVRGLDIKGVAHVINYDMPDDVDEYVHRIGRTGRVGNTGKATSFYDGDEDSGVAGEIVRILAEVGQTVPDWLVSAGGGRSSGGGAAAVEDDDEEWG